MKVKYDHRSKFSNLSNQKKEAWKIQGFNASPTRDLCEIPVQCSTNWAMKPHIGSEINFIGFTSSREEWNCVKYIWNISYSNCRCIRKWRMIIRSFFTFESCYCLHHWENTGNGLTGPLFRLTYMYSPNNPVLRWTLNTGNNTIYTRPKGLYMYCVYFTPGLSLQSTLSAYRSTVQQYPVTFD